MNKGAMSGDDTIVSRWQTPHLDGDGITDEIVKTEQEIRDQIYEDAFVKGHQAGMKSGQEKIQQQLTLLNNFISNLTRPFNDMNDDITRELAKLAGKIARSLVKRELATEPETIIALVRDTIKAMNSNPEDINVHMNPADAEILQEINRRTTEKKQWTIIEDPLIPRGDCKVGSKDSLIDENLQDRINLIIAQCLSDKRGESKHE